MHGTFKSALMATFALTFEYNKNNEFFYKSLSKFQIVSGKKNNWREKHEQLIEGLRAARGVQQALASGKPLPPPPPAAINPDYVQCPSCMRR